MEAYRYRPLSSPTAFRLIRRVGIGDDGVIELSLETYDLMYHCLSYTWGNPHADGIGFEESFRSRAASYDVSKAIDIRCDGKVIKIGKNLHDFLTQAPTGWSREIRSRQNRETGQTLLHDRAANSHPHVVHSYVSQGDDVHVRDTKGKTPLHYAAENGQLENVKILLKAGADADAKDNEGLSPEEVARQGGHLYVAECLRTCSAGGQAAIQELTKDVPPFRPYDMDDYIWIDALCIDQSNTSERGAQVSIMDRIYSSAAYVIIWLGEEDKHVDTALITISKIKSALREFVESDLVPYREHEPEEYARNSVPYISQEEWDSLAALLLRQWFRRVWVIQEAVLASPSVLYCGTKRLYWSDLEHVVFPLRRRAEALGNEPSSRYVPLGKILTGVEMYFTFMAALRTGRETLRPDREGDGTGKPDREYFTLKNLIVSGFPFQATDPRDKVYALLPMASLGPPGAVKTMMKADYELPAARCYARFMKLLIEEKNSLWSLNLVHGQDVKRIPDLPSWVPDFSLDGAGMELAPENHTGGNSLRPYNLDLVWNQLGLRVRKLDTVANTAAPRPLGGNNRKFQLDESWFDLVLSLSEPNQHYKAMSQSLAEVLWRTLCWDTTHNTFSTPAPPEYASMFNLFLCAMICYVPEVTIRNEMRMTEKALFAMAQAASETEDMSSTGTVGLGMEAHIMEPERSLESRYFDSVRHVLLKLEALRTLAGDDPSIPTTDEVAAYFASAADPFAPAGIPGGSMPPGIEPYVFAHSRAYSRTRLFTTGDGFLALGSATVESGDIVCLVGGYDMPVLLRPVSTSGREDIEFSFIGSAYVHGVMHGEAIKGGLGDGEMVDVVLS
ncbi:heterokaryon incompatibility protein-domain-containing protein [Cercophora newfieldiana]|uniref:Heterokaryon incompatibility protein-domain-containing protein n=1 Tax=Cercophora newfieldiana TaxID=92897 RepID=A0AA39Y008_9PEZI|nr:heterokaryon incompatibility protein-domain-containing protein [Cercophora newfieldiana]